MDFQHLEITLKDGNRNEYMTVTATENGVSFDWNNNKIKDEREFMRWFERICRMIVVKEIIVAVSDTEREFIHLNHTWDYMHITWKENEDRFAEMSDNYEKEDETPGNVYDWYYSTVLTPFIQEVIVTANILMMKKKLEGQECCVLNTPLTIENVRVFGHCKHMVCDEAFKGMRRASLKENPETFKISCPMCRHIHTLDEMMTARSLYLA